MSIGSNVQRFPDFTLYDHGFTFLLHPHTETARNWIAEHISEDAYLFGNAVVIEHRFMADIVKGIQMDGLEVR